MFNTAFLMPLMIAMACQQSQPETAPVVQDNKPLSSSAAPTSKSTPKQHPSGMAPKAVSPPGKHTRNEDEPQPGVLTEQQLQGMLRTGRDIWQKPTEVLQYAGIENGDHVADIGCGAGYWSYHIASAVGDSGKIYAVDFDANAIDYLTNTRLAENPIPNLETVLSRSFDTLLPENSIDHAILVDVHFFRQPNEPNGSQISEDFPRFYTSIQKALRPNGTLVILEHKETYASSRQVTQEQMVEQLKPIGFVLDKSSDMIDRQYFMIFKIQDQ